MNTQEFTLSPSTTQHIIPINQNDNSILVEWFISSTNTTQQDIPIEISAKINNIDSYIPYDNSPYHTSFKQNTNWVNVICDKILVASDNIQYGNTILIRVHTRNT